MLQWLEARRQQVPEPEVAAVERRMEEARENIRKAEVGCPLYPQAEGSGVASRPVTPRERDVRMAEAEDALPLWQPRWGLGVMGLAGLSPLPHRCPL